MEISLNPWKKNGVAWLSPPSAWTGSTINAAILWGSYCSVMICSNASKHFCSSSWFSCSNSFNGYFNAGNGALGHGNAGISNLWIALDLVVDKDPNNRPWKPLSNERITMSDDPGPWFSITEVNSLSEKSWEPLFLECWYINAALYAVSLAQDPLNAVHTLSNPGGAPARIPPPRQNVLVIGRWETC